MSDRKKGNVPSKRPPHRDSDLLQPPSNNRYPGGDGNPYTGPSSGNLYEGYDQHGFLLSENSSQPHAAESHPQGHTTRSRPQSYRTQHHLDPYDARHHRQQDPFERPPPVRTQYQSSLIHGLAELEDPVEAEPKHEKKKPSGATNPANVSKRRSTRPAQSEESNVAVLGHTTDAPGRPTARPRYYDEPAETEESAVSMINQNTGSRRSRRDNERRYDSTAENEQSALTIRGPTTIATRPPTDDERRSNRPAENEDSGVAITNQNTGFRRSRRDNERHSNRTTENEQSALAVLGNTTVTTRRQPDSERRSDKKVHSSKEKKSTKTPASGIKIRVGPTRPGTLQDVNVDVGTGDREVDYEMTDEIRKLTLHPTGEKKSKSRRKEGKAIEPSRGHRNMDKDDESPTRRGSRPTGHGGSR